MSQTIALITSSDYSTNFRQMNIGQLFEQHNLVLSENGVPLITEKLNDFIGTPQMIYQDLLMFNYAVREFNDEDDLSDPKVAARVLVKREAFETSKEIIETETIRFSFAV